MSDLIFYGEIYTLLGILTMLAFDLMHFGTRNMTTEEEFNNNAFSNSERLYVFILWPIVVISFFREILKTKQD